MPEIELRGGGSALLLVGLIWIPIGYVAGSTALMLAAAAVASLGVIVVGFVPGDGGERMALDADELEES